LIKSLVAVGVAILFCLLAGNWVIAVLKRPLDHARVRYPSNLQVISFFLGTNRLGTFQVDRTQPGGPLFGTNRAVSVQLEPVTLPDHTRVLGWRLDETTQPENSRKLDIPIINLGPASAFIVAFKVAIYAGIVIASPFLLYFVGMFVFPALKIKEKKYTSRALMFGGGLFLVGVGFCYFFLMPLALVASVQYSEWLGFTANQWRAEDYIGFVCKFMLGMGVGFELPVVVLTLVKIGVLDYRALAGARRYVIVINFILGAVLTTPEVITQVLMAIPLQILYEISVWIAWYWERRDKQREQAQASD
jgi:sec-independent protein translocase protein TatC